LARPMRARPMSHVSRPQIREGSIEVGTYWSNGQNGSTQNNPTIPYHLSLQQPLRFLW
jgi:hypothetical protein